MSRKLGFSAMLTFVSLYQDEQEEEIPTVVVSLEVNSKRSMGSAVGPSCYQGQTAFVIFFLYKQPLLANLIFKYSHYSIRNLCGNLRILEAAVLPILN